MHPMGIRPVAFNRYRIEIFFLDQTTGNGRPFTVEIMGPMRGLTDQDQAPVTDPAHQGIIVVSVECERNGSPIDLGYGDFRRQNSSCCQRVFKRPVASWLQPSPAGHELLDRWSGRTPDTTGRLHRTFRE